MRGVKHSATNQERVVIFTPTFTPQLMIDRLKSRQAAE
jgi:hypothetical protein